MMLKHWKWTLAVLLTGVVLAAWSGSVGGLDWSPVGSTITFASGYSSWTVDVATGSAGEIVPGPVITRSGRGKNKKTSTVIYQHPDILFRNILL